MTTAIDRVGTVLDGRFRIESLIGHGRLGGFVYRGRDASRSTPVAVRVLAVPAELEGAPLRAALERFEAEAALLERLSSSAADAERLIAHGVADGAPYCVFEWLEGRSLEAHLAEDARARSLGEALAILEPAARALAAAHASGIVHGDVRPANLWLAVADGRTRMKLTQFVVASRIGADAEPSFSPEYGAPEHFKRSYGPVSAATDVYGLALTLVELVSGRRALEGADDSELYLATSDVRSRPTLRARDVEVGSEAEAVLQRALAVDPKRRPPDARVFWDALVAAVPELTPGPPSVRPTPSEAAPPSVVDRSAPRAWLAVGAIAAVATLGIASKLVSRAPAVLPAEPSTLASTAAPPTDDEGDEPSLLVQPFLTGMVHVPAGTFVMGSHRGGRADGPAHRVRITRAFAIDLTEVTAEAYAACVESGGCTRGRVHGPQATGSDFGCNRASDRPKHPANCVDRAQARTYCESIGKRLPTEAEWEYAARGEDARDYPWGNDVPTACTTAVVWTLSGACSGRIGTGEVASAPDGRSAFGALDMAGNVWEWVADAFAPYSSTPDGGEIVDPSVGTAADGRGVLRGGSWDYSPLSAKATYRLPYPATAGNATTGFRCARDL